MDDELSLTKAFAHKNRIPLIAPDQFNEDEVKFNMQKKYVSALDVTSVQGKRRASERPNLFKAKLNANVTRLESPSKKRNTIRLDQLPPSRILLSLQQTKQGAEAAL